MQSELHFINRNGGQEQFISFTYSTSITYFFMIERVCHFGLPIAINSV